MCTSHTNDPSAGAIALCSCRYRSACDDEGTAGNNGGPNAREGAGLEISPFPGATIGPTHGELLGRACVGPRPSHQRDDVTESKPNVTSCQKPACIQAGIFRGNAKGGDVVASAATRSRSAALDGPTMFARG